MYKARLDIVLTDVGDLRFDALTRGNWFDVRTDGSFNSPGSSDTLDETASVPMRSSAGHSFYVEAVNPYIGYPRIMVLDHKTERTQFLRFKVGESFQFDNIVDGLRLSGWREGDDDSCDSKRLFLRIELAK